MSHKHDDDVQDNPPFGELPEGHSSGLEALSRGSGAQIRMAGTRYGIRISLPVSSSEETLLELLSRIPPQAYQLPDSEGIALDFQSRACSERLLLRLLQEVVWGKGFRVLAWLSDNEESLQLFRRSGFAVAEPVVAPTPQPEAHRTAKECGPPRVRIVYNSMRSGQVVEAEGDVVLWGHLNSGAEVSAGGSVIVSGKLKGLVHAGRGGREDVFVMAGSFEAQQVRLGHKLCYADPSTAGWQKPVLIVIEDGEPIVRENEFLSGAAEP